MLDFGLETFTWPTLPEVRQEPLDPKTHLFGNNGHMTIRVIIKAPEGDHRSEEERHERNETARKKSGGNIWKEPKARRTQKDIRVLVLANRGAGAPPR